MIKLFSCLFLIFSSSLLFCIDQQDLPEPYNTAQILPFDSHGFYGNGLQLESLIKTNHVKIVIEVGCWLGASTRHIASLLPPEGKVYAVDHWKGSVEHQPGNANWYHALPVLYEVFLSNVIHAGLTDKIIPVKLESLEAAKQLSYVAADLIFIDAGHDTPAVYADLCAWYPYVKGHGILCGDDWNWHSVRAAVEAFADERGLKILVTGYNFWRLLD